jgi:hypothetical protein
MCLSDKNVSDIVIETLLCRILTIVYKGDLISIMTIHELSLMTHFLIGAQSLMLSLNDAFFDRCPVTDVVICYNFYKSVCPVLHLRRVLKKYI